MKLSTLFSMMVKRSVNSLTCLSVDTLALVVLVVFVGDVFFAGLAIAFNAGLGVLDAI